MIRLSSPEIDSKELWDKIVKKKRIPTRNKLLPYKSRINERYDYYLQNTGCLDRIHSTSSVWTNIKLELISCYGKNINFSSAREKIFETQKTIHSKCPYCMINSPDTLDHYFDKDDYPEYAIFPPNLVPCCYDCNNKKGTTIFNVAGERQYIHFYYDQLPDYQFLFMNIKFYENGSSPFVSVYIKFQEEVPFHKVLIAHFKNLDLIKKYQEQIIHSFSLIVEEVKYEIEYGFSEKELYNIILSRYRSFRKMYGENYWETFLYKRLIDNPESISNLIELTRA